MRAISPNLMFAKITRYIVVYETVVVIKTPVSMYTLSVYYMHYTQENITCVSHIPVDQWTDSSYLVDGGLHSLDH